MELQRTLISQTTSQGKRPADAQRRRLNEVKSGRNWGERGKDQLGCKSKHMDFFSACSGEIKLKARGLHPARGRPAFQL